MEKNIETDDSQNVEEELTPEQEPETEEPEEQEEEESEVEAKNRQLFERAKKAETEAKELKAKLLERESDEDDDSYSDDTKELKAQIKALDGKIAALQEKSTTETLYQKYPILKEKYAEFDEYRNENPGMSMEVSAKAFLAEHDLLNVTPKRKGLEKAGGGRRTAPKTTMSSDDAKRLRETNYSEYKKQLMAGKIQIS